MRQTKEPNRHERAKAARQMVVELLRTSTQRDLAKEIGVTQYWVYRHAHTPIGVPSDAIWRRLTESYRGLGYAIGQDANSHGKTKKIGINRDDAGAHDKAVGETIIRNSDRGGSGLQLYHRV